MSGAVAITAAVVSIGIAAEVGSTFAIIAAVGATIGAVGAVTHIKELQYAGMAIGAVGGIGALASSAGLFAGAADVFGSMSGEGLGAVAAGTTAAETASPFASAASNVATDAGTFASAAGAAAETAAAPLTSPADAVQNVIQSVNDGSGGVTIGAAADVTPPGTVAPTGADIPETGIVKPLTVADAPQAPTVPVTGEARVPGLSYDGGVDSLGRPTDAMGNVIAQGDATGAGTLNNPAATPDAPPSPTPQTVTGATSTSPVAMPGSGTTPAPGGGPSSLGGTLAADAGKVTGTPWGAIGDFAKANPMMAFAATQAIGSFLSGALKSPDPAQTAAFEAQARANLAAANLADRQAALLQRRTDNISGPMPVAQRALPGLINSTGRQA